MSLSFSEIKERLMRLDEVDLCEVLEISSEDLVNRFSDKIEDKIDYFEKDLEDED